MSLPFEVTEETRLKYCKRKAGYPLRSMAQRVADAHAKQEGKAYVVYECGICHKFHIGHAVPPNKAHKLTAPEVVMADHKSKFFINHQGNILAKIKDSFENHYIFMVPADCAEVIEEVLDKGLLISVKQGKGLYTEKDGKRSNNWQIYNAILPLYVKDMTGFIPLIEEHKEQMGYVGDPLPVPTLSRKLQIDKGLIKTVDTRTPPTASPAETFKGKTVLRDEKNRPYIPTHTKCHFCMEPIEIRAYISCDRNGAFTWLGANKPVGQLAKPLVVRGRNWACEKCIEKGALRGTLITKPPVETPVQPESQKQVDKEQTTPFNLEVYDDSILKSLQALTLDPSVDAEFVRGAAWAACRMLTGE